MATITKHKPAYIKGLTLKKPAVLVDADEYEGMKETLEILLEDPEIFKRLEKADREIKKGKGIPNSWSLQDNL